MIITDEQDPSRKRPVAPEAPVSPSTEGGYTAPTITSVSSASMSTFTHAPGPSRNHPILDEEAGHSDAGSPPSYEETTRLWRRQDAKGKTLWRFIQTLLVAVLVYVVLGGLAGIIWDTAHKRGAGSTTPPVRPPSNSDPAPPWNPPNGPSPSECTPSDSWGWASDGHSANFTLRLDNHIDSLLFTATEFSAGKIIFSDDFVNDNDVLIHIEAKHSSKRVIRGAKVCLTQSYGDATLNIHSGTTGYQAPTFIVTVNFPIPKNPSGQQTFKLLETRLPYYQHWVKTLEAISFEKVLFETQNAPVDAQSLHAHTVELRTTNSPISGYYNVSNSILLDTSNAPIQAHVTLRSNGRPSNIVMSTSNAPIEANIDLRSTLSSGTGGIFNITSTTRNARSITNIHTQPLDSLLDVVAETTQEDIRVHLAAAFEGYFDLQTTFNRAEINVDDHVADPAKQDRERIVTHAAQRGGIVGAAAWVPGRKSAPKGSAKVKTVNGRATLNI